MDYDLARADVLLSDLLDIGRGQMPVAQLAASKDGGPAVTGTFTRLGLLRMGVRLARAALSAQARVVVFDNGNVSQDLSGTDVIVEVFLADDAPVQPDPQSNWWWASAAVWLALTILCLIGLVTVARWILAQFTPN
jgi:hypothetical protein